MNDLISRITEATGLDASVAQHAVGLVLGFLQQEGPDEAVQALMEHIPGAAALIDQHGGDTGGGGLMGMLGGMLGNGGVMELGSKLMGAGLDMGQIQTLGQEVFAYAKEHAGEEAVGKVIGSIPGLSQFV